MLDSLTTVGTGSRWRRLNVPAFLPLITAAMSVGCADSKDAPVPSSLRALEQINYVATGLDTSGRHLPIPSIDPAGVTYHPELGGLLLVDSEINEVREAFDSIGATWFLASMDLELVTRQWDMTAVDGVEQVRNLESTGIAYCEQDGHVYVTNDDLDLLFRYSYDGETFRVVDFVSTAPQTDDPEGVTCDPETGILYVVGGEDANIVAYAYNGNFSLHETLELHDTALHRHGKLDDVEGIAFDPVSRHLFVVSDLAKRIVEFDLAGRFVSKFELDELSPPPIAPQGLTIGPSSIDPDRRSMFLVDGGLDNDEFPEERDGAIYELMIVDKDD